MAHRGSRRVMGQLGCRFTWEETCRGVGDSTGSGGGPAHRPLIKTREERGPMAMALEFERAGGVGAVRRFVDVACDFAPKQAAALQSGFGVLFLSICARV
jgi:hypothetical protein